MISANAVAVRLPSSNPKGALNMCLYPSAYIKKIVDDIDGSIYVLIFLNRNNKKMSVRIAFF